MREKKKMEEGRRTLRFIVMGCGYAEDSTTSVLIYQCEFFGNPGYTSYKAAITDLALDLYAKFYEERLSVYEKRYTQDVKECCRLTLIAEKTAKFCMFCRTELQDRVFDYQEFMQYVRSLHNTISDSYGDAEWANGRDLAWWPYATDNLIGASKEQVIYIADNGEKVLLSALLEAKPELRDQDQDDEACLDFCEWETFKSEKQPTYR